MLHTEFTRRLIKNLRPHHIGGEQIGGELNALEAGAHRFGERAYGERFREARHTFQEDVPAGEERDQQALHHVLLPNDSLADFAQDPLHQSRVLRRGDARGHDWLLL